MDTLTELFCFVDDFCKRYERWERSSFIKQGSSAKRRPQMSLSECMTLVILFHQVRYRQFKLFYVDYVKRYLGREFPNLPSYQRFIELLPRSHQAFNALLHSLKGPNTGISIMDSTTLKVCDNRRIYSHRVFRGMASRGKTSMGWFFGMKLHVVINSLGDLLACHVSTGATNDRVPVKKLVRRFPPGTLVADKGYLSKELGDELKKQGIKLLTPVRKNMKKPNHSVFEKALLASRCIIETVFDQMKNLCQIEHSRHRGIGQFMVHLLGGLVAYALQSNKPKLCLRFKNLLSCRQNNPLLLCNNTL